MAACFIYAPLSWGIGAGFLCVLKFNMSPRLRPYDRNIIVMITAAAAALFCSLADDKWETLSMKIAFA